MFVVIIAVFIIIVVNIISINLYTYFVTMLSLFLLFILSLERHVMIGHIRLLNVPEHGVSLKHGNSNGIFVLIEPNQPRRP